MLITLGFVAFAVMVAYATARLWVRFRPGWPGGVIARRSALPIPLLIAVPSLVMAGDAIRDAIADGPSCASDACSWGVWFGLTGLVGAGLCFIAGRAAAGLALRQGPSADRVGSVDQSAP